MVLYPECQKRAQDEIDAVVGTNRLPELEDRERLPYVECVMQETMRYRLNTCIINFLTAILLDGVLPFP